MLDMDHFVAALPPLYLFRDVFFAPLVDSGTGATVHSAGQRGAHLYVSRRRDENDDFGQLPAQRSSGKTF